VVLGQKSASTVEQQDLGEEGVEQKKVEGVKEPSLGGP